MMFSPLTTCWNNLSPQGAVDGRVGCIGALVVGECNKKGHLKNREKGHLCLP